MKKIAVLLALMLVSFAGYSQTKEELKAARKADKYYAKAVKNAEKKK